MIRRFLPIARTLLVLLFIAAVVGAVICVLLQLYAFSWEPALWIGAATACAFAGVAALVTLEIRPRIRPRMMGALLAALAILAAASVAISQIVLTLDQIVLWQSQRKGMFESPSTASVYASIALRLQIGIMLIALLLALRFDTKVARAARGVAVSAVAGLTAALPFLYEYSDEGRVPLAAILGIFMLVGGAVGWIFARPTRQRWSNKALSILLYIVVLAVLWLEATVLLETLMEFDVWLSQSSAPFGLMDPFTQLRQGLTSIVAVLMVIAAVTAYFDWLRRRTRATACNEALIVASACPRCQSEAPRASGWSRCAACSMLMHIAIEEPRCVCGHLLRQPADQPCTECGRELSVYNRR